MRWESAGATLPFGHAGPWEALPGCDLVLTGNGIDGPGLCRQLDACLADDHELSEPARWPDPFESALGTRGRVPG